MVDARNESFRRCLLEDEGQEGREKLLVVCVNQTLPQLPIWLRNRTVREMAVSTCRSGRAHSTLEMCTHGLVQKCGCPKLPKPNRKLAALGSGTCGISKPGGGDCAWD